MRVVTFALALAACLVVAIGCASSTVRRHALPDAGSIRAPRPSGQIRTATTPGSGRTESLPRGGDSFDDPGAAMQFHLRPRLPPGKTQIPLDHRHAELQKLRVDAGHYYLVVPRNVDAEGLYGTDSAGWERPQGSPACAPQDAGACPPG